MDGQALQRFRSSLSFRQTTQHQISFRMENEGDMQTAILGFTIWCAFFQATTAARPLRFQQRPKTRSPAVNRKPDME